MGEAAPLELEVGKAEGKMVGLPPELEATGCGCCIAVSKVDPCG